MTSIGVFRDDFYNASSVLPQSVANATTQNGGVLQATSVAGAQDVYLLVSGQTGAQALTTDTAANIIAQLQKAVAVALKAAPYSFAAGVQPPDGVPNLFNLTFTLTIVNSNTAAGAITLTGGTGVTISGTATVAINVSRKYVVSITSPTTITLTNVGAGAN